MGIAFEIKTLCKLYHNHLTNTLQFELFVSFLPSDLIISVLVEVCQMLYSSLNAENIYNIKKIAFFIERIIKYLSAIYRQV